MEAKIQKLKEKDLREQYEELQPNAFLSAYIQSNFPQTVALASKEQKKQLERNQLPAQPVNYMKKPSNGISFDNPASS